MNGTLIAAGAFAAARWRAARLKTRVQISQYQDRRVHQLMRSTLPRFAYYRERLAQGFEGLPLVDKAELNAHFAQCNAGGFSPEFLKACLDAGRQQEGAFVFGRSTGTSGNRGYYVISNAERFVWLGTILAKTLPDALWRKHRVALALPGISALYRSAGSGSRIALGAFDLAMGIDHWLDAIPAFAPDTIVAPPKVLRYLAELGKLDAQHIFSGSEVLDPVDQSVIEGITGRTVRQIYMATEGLFGVSCSHGTVHLAEDIVKFEWQALGDSSPYVMPIVTDFTRHEQALVRYRMNDLLVLGDQVCPCGCAYQTVKRIEGRQDDVFIFLLPNGDTKRVTPDVFRHAVTDTDPAITDYRVLQTAGNAIEVHLEATLAASLGRRVQERLQLKLLALGLSATTITIVHGIATSFDEKLRRVRRLWNPPSLLEK